MVKVEKLIKAIADNYNYSFAQWQPGKVSAALSAIDPELAAKFDYSSPETLLAGIASTTKSSISRYVVKHNFPVWTNHYKEKAFVKKSKNLVITYCPENSKNFDSFLDSIRSYAKKIKADCIVLSGRKQGSSLLERFRIKRFVEKYDRTIYFDYNTAISPDCPNLFEIVPENSVGIYDYSQLIDKDSTEFFQYKQKRMRMLKADAFSRFPVLSQEVLDPLEFESNQMNSWYDTGVIVCSSKHANLWNPITFPFSGLENDDTRWMEISSYREGYEIFDITSQYNFSILFNQKINHPKTYRNIKVVRYEGLPLGSNIRYTWLDDNNITGYQEKPAIDLDKFQILSLGHEQSQFDSIQDRSYLTKINLNELETKLDNIYTESRIYSLDFDKLFDPNKEVVGLTTASWNKKYVGLNPIDQLHQWAGIRDIDENTILCASTEPCDYFIHIITNVLNISYEKLVSFLELVGLTKADDYGALSNQIIAKTSIVEELFQFYKDQAVLDKIGFFIKQNDIVASNERFERIKAGYLSEFTTLFWIANQDITILPQEVRRLDWYW